jgi:hypothetical protein
VNSPLLDHLLKVCNDEIVPWYAIDERFGVGSPYRQVAMHCSCPKKRMDLGHGPLFKAIRRGFYDVVELLIAQVTNDPSNVGYGFEDAIILGTHSLEWMHKIYCDMKLPLSEYFRSRLIYAACTVGDYQTAEFVVQLSQQYGNMDLLAGIRAHPCFPGWSDVYHKLTTAPYHYPDNVVAYGGMFTDHAIINEVVDSIVKGLVDDEHEHDFAIEQAVKWGHIDMVDRILTRLKQFEDHPWSIASTHRTWRRLLDKILKITLLWQYNDTVVPMVAMLCKHRVWGNLYHDFTVFDKQHVFRFPRDPYVQNAETNVVPQEVLNSLFDMILQPSTTNPNSIGNGLQLERYDIATTTLYCVMILFVAVWYMHLYGGSL